MSTVSSDSAVITTPGYPPVSTRGEWQREHAALLQAEKELTRARDALNARRRRLPMVRVEHEYVFDGSGGPLRLIDLFEGRDQLVVYHNMLTADHICPGCSQVSDHLMNHWEHLHARRTSFCMTAHASIERIEAIKARMGWTFPWVSCERNSFHEDLVSSQGAPFAFLVFMQRAGEVFQTWFTSGRGAETPTNTFTMLDLTPWGRQENWEDSPPGWPQEQVYSWQRLHDEY